MSRVLVSALPVMAMITGSVTTLLSAASLPVTQVVRTWEGMPRETAADVKATAMWTGSSGLAMAFLGLGCFFLFNALYNRYEARRQAEAEAHANRNSALSPR